MIVLENLFLEKRCRQTAHLLSPREGEIGRQSRGKFSGAGASSQRIWLHFTLVQFNSYALVVKKKNPMHLECITHLKVLF